MLRDDYPNFELREIQIKITDERDGDTVSTKDIPNIMLDQNVLQFDNNKICQYNWVERNAVSPILVNKGQNIHFRIQYYSRSIKEKFFYGTNGKDFAKVKNTDMGMFSVKNSKFGNSTTNEDYGQIPGLLFKYV